MYNLIPHKFRKKTVPNNPVADWDGEIIEQYCINYVHFIKHKNKELSQSGYHNGNYQYDGNYTYREFRKIKPGLLMESTTWLGISPIAKKQEEKGYYE